MVRPPTVAVAALEMPTIQRLRPPGVGRRGESFLPEMSDESKSGGLARLLVDLDLYFRLDFPDLSLELGNRRSQRFVDGHLPT